MGSCCAILCRAGMIVFYQPWWENPREGRSLPCSFFCSEGLGIVSSPIVGYTSQSSGTGMIRDECGGGSHIAQYYGGFVTVLFIPPARKLVIAISLSYVLLALPAMTIA